MMYVCKYRFMYASVYLCIMCVCSDVWHVIYDHFLCDHVWGEMRGRKGMEVGGARGEGGGHIGTLS